MLYTARMALRTSPPFRADHVGSLLRPPSLHRARADHAAGRIEDRELHAAEDDAIREAVTMQEEIELEQRDEVKRRIEQASRYVDVDQLCLSPQCGFSSTVEGNDLTIEQQAAKLRLIVDVAEDVWGS